MLVKSLFESVDSYESYNVMQDVAMVTSHLVTFLCQYVYVFVGNETLQLFIKLTD